MVGNVFHAVTLRDSSTILTVGKFEISCLKFKFFIIPLGNCFSYNLHLDPASLVNITGSLSGFTGPKFGLELTLNMETDQYMPTSREAGAKVIVHDAATRADPDQDAVHVPPGKVPRRVTLLVGKVRKRTKNKN